MNPLSPLEAAVVGDWARYQMLGDRRMTLRVIDASDRDVMIEVEMVTEGKPLALPARRKTRRDLNRPRAHAHRVNAVLNVKTERVEAAGRAWDARRLDATWVDEGIACARTTWMAEDGPVYGVLKMVQTADGKRVAAMELIDAGHGRTTSPAVEAARSRGDRP